MPMVALAVLLHEKLSLLKSLLGKGVMDKRTGDTSTRSKSSRLGFDCVLLLLNKKNDFRNNNINKRKTSSAG